MSVRLFIHYCAVCGGCAAYLGWVLGRLLTVQHHVTRAAVQSIAAVPRRRQKKNGRKKAQKAQKKTADKGQKNN